MKESLWGYILLLFGIFIIVVMMIIRDYQTTNDEEYYLLKEVTQAAMIDSVDYTYYREYDDLKIIEEKFVENFVRRFSESMSNSKNYKIEIFEVSENPPKVSVRVSSKTGNYQVDAGEGMVDFGVINILSAILDMKYNITPNEDRKNGTEERPSDSVGGPTSGGPSGDGTTTANSIYYSVGYSSPPSSFPQRSSYTIKLNKIYYQGRPINASKVTSCNVASAGAMTSIADMSKYIDAKLAGEMVQVGGDESAGIITNAGEMYNHSLRSNNFTVSASCRVSGGIIYIDVATSTNNINGVNILPSVKRLDGVTVRNVYFIPIKYTIKFVYQTT